MRRTACLLSLLLALLLLAAPSRAQENEECFVCHGDASMLEGIEGAERLLVDRTTFENSVHAKGGLDCVYCHQALAGKRPGPHARDLKPVNCGGCHREEKSQYHGSLHGYALSRGNPRAPTCASCHGTHEILPSRDPRSSTHKVQQPKTCAKCHGQAGLLTDQIVKLPESFRDYTQSVHGQGAEHGIAAAAACNDCHEVHDLKAAVDPESQINPRRQPSTCGKCHPDIQIEFEKSIHGRALTAGVPDSPTCTDCHGEHLILSPDNPEAKTHSSRLAKETCGTCHEDPVIVAKYRLRGDVVQSYADSYHGWVTTGGYTAAATCVSCHTSHSILPVIDPASTIHPNNVVQTCMECHEGATAKFAQSYTHAAASVTQNPVNRIIRNIYFVLIAVVIGGMVLHNLVVMNYFMIERRKAEKKSRWVVRFDRSQIWQHLLLSLAFIMLVITGFALRFPNSWWARFLSSIGMTEPVRGNLHRIFAVTLMLVGITHIWYIFFTRRGRGEFRAITPGGQDVRDLVNNVKFHTWRRKEKVKFGRYDYSQKAEYWALIWGTILMIITGLILWFPEEAVKVLPVWIIGVAQTIHYYEAWLATLAILVWHFFFVIFHPEEYPMSWTWLTGRMSEESVKKHHARWYEEEVLKNRDVDGDDSEPAPREPSPAEASD
jgi:formate dehydrogenase gamma subunit